METAPDSRIDGPRAFWTAIGCRSVGATLVTTASPDGPVGFLALSATHLCADPPTMMVSLDKRTSAAGDLLANGTFCINYLAKIQKPLLGPFFSKDGPKGADRFRGVGFHTLATGAPALDGAVGVLDCRVDEVIERHGTLIVLGRLIDAERSDAEPPLVSYAGAFE